MGGEAELRGFTEQLMKIDWGDVDMFVAYAPVTPFQISARDLLVYAKEDIKGGSERDYVNALSNANRAMHCRVDELLYVYNLAYFARTSKPPWDLPAKRKALRNVGSRAPEVLQQLVAGKRNVLEHKHKSPGNQQDIRNSVEIVELFLDSTESALEKAIIYVRVLTAPRPSPDKMSIHKQYADKYQILLDFDNEDAMLMYYQYAATDRPLERVDFGQCQRESVELLMRLILKTVSELNPSNESGGDWRKDIHSLCRSMLAEASQSNTVG